MINKTTVKLDKKLMEMGICAMFHYYKGHSHHFIDYGATKVKAIAANKLVKYKFSLHKINFNKAYLRHSEIE